MKIDIERLIDAVTAENEAYNEYCYSSKTLYRGPFEEITARKNHVNYAREVHDREQNAVDTLAEVFQMDTETRDRLYIAARAVNRWRIIRPGSAGYIERSEALGWLINI